MAAFSGTSISIGGSPAPSGAGGAPTPTPSTGGGKAFAGANISIGAKAPPVASSSPTAVPSPTTPVPSPAPVVPKSTGGFFSKAVGFVGKELGKASDFVSKVTTAPDPSTLGTNATANTLKYLPSELARSIPGVAEIQDNPDEAKYVTPDVVAHAVPVALGQTAKSIASMPVKAVADVYDAGRVFLGKNPNASLNLPVLGHVTSDIYDTVDRINNGEDPVVAALRTGSSSIFNVLFFADLANRVGGTRVTKTGEYKGDFNDIKPNSADNPEPRTGRLYQPNTTYNRGGAQVLTPEALDQMKSQGVPFGKNYDPTSPTFFRVTEGKGGAYTAEVMQLKPSYLQAAYSKLFGTKAAPTSIPGLLGAGETGGATQAEFSTIAEKATSQDVITIHSETVKGNDLKDAVSIQIKEAEPEVSPVPTQTTPAVAAFTPMSHTVMHNILRLGGGDTEQAKGGADILHKEIQQHLKTDGEMLTHTALMEKLGVDGETATKLINQARSTPTMPIAPKALTSAMINHGTIDGVNPKQPTKMSNNDAAPHAANAASIHWNKVQTRAIADGKPIVIGADDLKDYFGNDYNDNNHPVYSRAAFLEYERALKESPVKEIVFTGGGPASGKTELMTKDLVNRGFRGIVYDSNMANFDGVKKQIEMARAAGFKVTIKGVLPNLESARTFSILRENKIGRGISDATFARGHAGFPNVALKLAEEGIISEHDLQILDTRENVDFKKAFEMVYKQEYLQNPLEILRKVGYTEDNLKEQYGKHQFDATTGQRRDALPSGSGAGEASRESGTDQGDAIRKGDEGVLERAEEGKGSVKEIINSEYVPMRGFINPGAIAAPVVDAAKQVSEFVEHSQKTSELTGTVNDAIYQHEGARKAMRQRAIQLLQEQGDRLTAQQWEDLYHFDENPNEQIYYRGEGGNDIAQGKALLAEGRHFATDSEYPKRFGEVKEYTQKSDMKVFNASGLNFSEIRQKLGLSNGNYISPSKYTSALKTQGYDVLKYDGTYKSSGKSFTHVVEISKDSFRDALTSIEKQIYTEVIVPLKKALRKARDEYRELGGHITSDLQMEMTPRYAKEKGGPIDKALRAIKEGSKERLGVANGGLLSKSVAGGAKHRIFHALVDSEGNRTVVSIPNPKTSRVTAFRNNVLTDIGPKSGKDGHMFTDEEGKEYKIEQATTKEIEAHTRTRYHKNVLANYVLAFDRTNNALSALKLLERIKDTPEFGEIIVKNDPEEAPPAGWKDLSGVLPQFRGYYAEPKLWEALKDLATRLTGREPFPVLDEVNNFLTSLIVLNPVMHFPNVLQGWATATAAEGAIPGVSKNSTKNFARAFNEVKNKGPLYLHYLEHGAPLMALKNTAREFSDAVLNQYSEEVERDPTQWEFVSKTLGYANPAKWFKGIMHLNETVTWGGNDIMFLQAMLDHADRTGSTPEEAIAMVSKRMADYRLPSRIGPGKLGRAVSLAMQSRALLFARYHYSGVIKPWIESVGDAGGKKSSWQQRRQGLRALAYLGLMSLIVYPFIDKLIRGISGSPLSYMTMAGPTKLVQDFEKLTDKGAVGVPAFLGGVFTPSPAVTAMVELGFDVDLYTRDPIYNNPQNEGLGGFATSMIAPLSAGSRMNPTDFALSLFGIYTPKSGSGQNALNAQKYDEKPLLEVQVKKDILAGNVAKANAEMKDFNDRAIANYNQAMLQTGGTPLPADGSQNDAFLKEWGIKSPGQKAISDAGKLYGDGSLTDKSSFVARVVMFAKATGTDPVTAFSDLFKGQRIVAVDNASFLNPDAAIIVQRDSQSESDARKSFGAAEGKTPEEMAGLQLDHIIPLEDGGINDVGNYQLTSSYNNEVLHGLVENPISAAFKEGQISRAHAREYIIRYKTGTLGEALTPAMLSEYQTKYNSQPITAQEVADLIASGKAK